MVSADTFRRQAQERAAAENEAATLPISKKTEDFSRRGQVATAMAARGAPDTLIAEMQALLSQVNAHALTAQAAQTHSQPSESLLESQLLRDRITCAESAARVLATPTALTLERLLRKSLDCRPKVVRDLIKANENRGALHVLESLQLNTQRKLVVETATPDQLLAVLKSVTEVLHLPDLDLGELPLARASALNYEDIAHLAMLTTEVAVVMGSAPEPMAAAAYFISKVVGFKEGAEQWSLLEDETSKLQLRTLLFAKFPLMRQSGTWQRSQQPAALAGVTASASSAKPQPRQQNQQQRNVAAARSSTDGGVKGGPDSCQAHIDDTSNIIPVVHRASECRGERARGQKKQ
jgi:hypothetical protein